jgi:hypothetical protein
MILSRNSEQSVELEDRSDGSTRKETPAKSSAAGIRRIRLLPELVSSN